MRGTRRLLSTTMTAAGMAGAMLAGAPAQAEPGSAASQIDDKIKHVLLISIDGFHAVDLANCLQADNPDHQCRNLARLTKRGITYVNASTTKPSDSFPGIIAQVAGGTPKSTGVYYDDSYDRTLFAPSSNCTVGPGTETQYAENLEFDNTLLDGGVLASLTTNSAIAISPANLPGALVSGKCELVWPHNFLRVNTIFGVLHNHGKRTAWTDKHPAYDILNGPNIVNGKLVLDQGPGGNIDDFFAPEINSLVTAQNVALVTNNPPNGLINPAIDFTGSIKAVEFYDEIKVKAVVNQINGFDHTGKKKVGTPTIFGMNFQAVSVGQKLPGNGYLDSRATPSDGLQSAIGFVDTSIGQFLDALDRQGLSESTLVIVSAKHGQSPIDPHRFHRITDSKNGAVLTTALNNFNNDDAFHIADDTVLEWLSPGRQGDTDGVIDDMTAQQANGADLGIGEFLSGNALKLRFRDPATDSRVPDFIITPNVGVVYANNPTKIAEHGGFNEDDVHVALVVSHPDLSKETISTAVQTTQIAPTILRVLGINPNELEAVRAEETPVLPEFE
jgi:type I phosphodiesterase/nucleotide pyrophosphatase